MRPELTLKEMIANVMKVFPGTEFYKRPLFDGFKKEEKKKQK